MSQIGTYISTLKTLLDPIVFDGSTLGALSLIKTYQKSVNDKPRTQINIFGGLLRSNFNESKQNKREHTIIIRIQTLAVNREDQAQLDIYELEEKIIEILENNLNNVNWESGYLNSYSLTSQTRNFDSNYFTKDIPISIFSRVKVTT